MKGKIIDGLRYVDEHIHKITILVLLGMPILLALMYLVLK